MTPDTLTTGTVTTDTLVTDTVTSGTVATSTMANLEFICSKCGSKGDKSKFTSLKNGKLTNHCSDCRLQSCQWKKGNKERVQTYIEEIRVVQPIGP